MPLEPLGPIDTRSLFRPVGRELIATTSIPLSDETAWRLLFSEPGDSARDGSIEIEGRPDLVAPLVRARSVIV